MSAERLPFSVHDLDRDGLIDRSEYAEFLSHFWARRAQGRGPVGGAAPLAFDEIDLDHDGLINEQEMAAAIERRHLRRRWRSWPRPRPPVIGND